MKTKGRYKLLAQVKDENEVKYVNEDGKTVIPCKWVEMKEVNLGSIKNPNKDIFQIRLEWIGNERRGFLNFEDE